MKAKVYRFGAQGPTHKGLYKGIIKALSFHIKGAWIQISTLLKPHTILKPHILVEVKNCQTSQLGAC